MRASDACAQRVCTTEGLAPSFSLLPSQAALWKVIAGRYTLDMPLLPANGYALATSGHDAMAKTVDHDSSAESTKP